MAQSRAAVSDAEPTLLMSMKTSASLPSVYRPAFQAIDLDVSAQFG